ILAIRSESDRIPLADETADFVYYYQTKLSPHGRPMRGGIWNGRPEGATAIYLGEDFINNGLKGVYALGGGQTALEEYQHASKLGLEMHYYPFLAKNPGPSGEFGALDQWIKKQNPMGNVDINSLSPDGLRHSFALAYQKDLIKRVSLFNEWK